MERAEAEDRTRAAYDVVADSYTELLGDWLGASAWERAMLDLFAAEVVADGGGPVVDLGCGSGRTIGHLRERGLDVSGIDLSPAMVAIAHRTHPGLAFEVGSMAQVDRADASLAGVAAWYSLIHTAPLDQPAALREVRRVLQPGGRLVVGFQVGEDDHVHLDRAYGHDVSLDVFRLSPDRLAADLDAAGLDVTARIVREPLDPEPQQQGYLFARRRG